MPVFVIVSPKGGAGKTTSALILASEIARIYTEEGVEGNAVTLLDADPNRPILDWTDGKHTPGNMVVVSDVDEENVFDRIDDAAASTPFVIVDLEGTAAKIVVLAVSRADFVIVPMQGSHLDAKQAGRAFKLIRQHESSMRRANSAYVLPYAVLLTRTSPIIRTKTLSHIVKKLKSVGIPIFKAELNEREAFRAVFSFKKTLDKLDAATVSNLDKAQANARSLAMEVLGAFRAGGIAVSGEAKEGALSAVDEVLEKMKGVPNE